MATPNVSCPAVVDDSFGPWAGDTCRGGFDFTLLFEESILSIPLHSLFLLILPFRVWQLVKMDTKVVHSFHRPLKLVCLPSTRSSILFRQPNAIQCASLCLLALNGVLLGLWAVRSSNDTTQTRATVPNAAVTLVASLGLCLLSWLEHSRTIRPSFLLTTFLLLSVLLEAARARTLWMLSADHTIPALFVSTVVLRLLMAALESVEKQSILTHEHATSSKEATSSTVNRSVFFWLTSLFANGYKKVLKLEDLYPLDDDLRSQPLGERLAEAWDKGVFSLTMVLDLRHYFVS
jgi:ATP-binding cassette, subfamily C (CFTR/MRP), member 1